MTEKPLAKLKKCLDELDLALADMEKAREKLRACMRTEKEHCRYRQPIIKQEKGK